MFGAGVAAQFLTARWSATRTFEAGMVAMVLGVGLAVVAVWLSPPSLGLFIAGGALIGVGSGAIFKGAVPRFAYNSVICHAKASIGYVPRLKL
jgi:hypothetical protein